jgi:hypothetical protein
MTRSCVVAMNLAKDFVKEEEKMTANVIKTAAYLVDALKKRDFYSAKLELKELEESFRILEEFQIKRERREKLSKVILDMRSRGINIDFASRSAPLSKKAKNTGEKTRNFKDKHKKRQQA